MATGRKCSTALDRLCSWFVSLGRRDQFGVMTLAFSTPMAVLVAILTACGWFG